MFVIRIIGGPFLMAECFCPIPRIYMAETAEEKARRSLDYLLITGKMICES